MVIYDDDVLEVRWKANGVHLIRRRRSSWSAEGTQSGDDYGPVSV